MLGMLGIDLFVTQKLLQFFSSESSFLWGGDPYYE